MTYRPIAIQAAASVILTAVALLGSPAVIVAQNALPRPDPAFIGTTERTLAGSNAETPAPLRPPAGAPNVVVVLIDDAGFGNPATFGGPVQTPTLDRLAARGLRYNRFHVTALCSPTRAALLSGRNHHSVGFGMVSEVHSNFPGYDAHWPQSAASLATILRDNGYNTAAIGKWHLTPDDEQGPAGPFDRWPNALGFEYFWGFLGGFSLYVEGGTLRHTYSFLGLKIDDLVASERLPEGKVQVRYEFTADTPGKLATGGTQRLFVAGKPVAEGRLEHTVPLRFSAYAGLDIGQDNGLPVSPGKIYYLRAPFPFEGSIERVVFDVR